MPYIDEVGKNTVRGVVEQRLQGLQHVLHVVRVQQAAENARLLLDDEHGLCRAREERLRVSESA